MVKSDKYNEWWFCLPIAGYMGREAVNFLLGGRIKTKVA